jgi:uncharacterized repeat protein (TIGR01451 family)
VPQYDSYTQCITGYKEICEPKCKEVKAPTPKDNCTYEAKYDDGCITDYKEICKAEKKQTDKVTTQTKKSKINVREGDKVKIKTKVKNEGEEQATKMVLQVTIPKGTKIDKESVKINNQKIPAEQVEIKDNILEVDIGNLVIGNEAELSYEIIVDEVSQDETLDVKTKAVVGVENEEGEIEYVTTEDDTTTINVEDDSLWDKITRFFKGLWKVISGLFD